MTIRLQELVAETRRVVKAPPGPPPREGLAWREQTHRWFRPEETRPTEDEGGLWDGPRYSDVMGEGVDYEQLQDFGLEATAYFDPKQAPSYFHVSGNDGVSTYTKGGYMDVNEALREGTRPNEGIQSEIDDILRVMQPLQEPQVLYRGINLPLEMHAGEFHELDTFWSTTRDPAVAYSFVSDGAMLEIEAPGDTWGVTLSSEDTKHWEDETILDMGQYFQVASVRAVPVLGMEGAWKGQITYIRGRIVQRADS